MNEVDHAVRAMLTDRARTVAEPPTLLDGVHRRIRRRRYRRRALVSAAAVVALLAAGTWTWGAERDDRLVPADRPSATEAPARPTGPTTDVDRALVPGVPAVPPAPLHPGTLPRGFPAATLSLDTKNSWVYITTRPVAPSTGLMSHWHSY